MPDKGSSYAEEGTLAHAYCALKLKEYLHLPVDSEHAEIDELQATYHTGEMDEATDFYRDIVLDKLAEAKKKTRDALLLVETRLDFSDFIPMGFGTADAVIIADGLMEVVDFKYGKGVRVEATDNPQMMIYALGAWAAFGFDYDIDRVRMTIVQPRIDNVSEFELPLRTLLAWGNGILRPKAMEAMSGEGELHPGDWCRFCKVKASCSALASQCLSTQDKAPDPRLIGKEEMETSVLPRLAAFKTWLSAVEEYALDQALSGVRYDGFKLVEGRSIRKITNPEDAEKALKGAGYLPEDYLRPAESRTLTDLEKLVGKKRLAELLKGCIDKPQGKPTLVPASDKRPELNLAANDFKDIQL